MADELEDNEEKIKRLKTINQRFKESNKITDTMPEELVNLVIDLIISGGYN